MIYPEFLDVLFPIDYSYGASAMSRFKTDITMVQSGYEKRNANWLDSLQEFNISHNIKTEEQVKRLKKFFLQMRGPLISFKFKDWSDYQTTIDEGIGNEDGALTGLPYVDLWKKYEETSDFDYYARKINLIVGDLEVDNIPFRCWLDGVEIMSPTVDHLNGRVLLTPLLSRNISTVTKAINGVVTTTAPHGFGNGDKIYLENITNMGGLNNRLFTISVINSTSFNINTDTTNFTVDGSGGTAKKYQQDEAEFIWQGEFYVNVRFAEDVSTISLDDYKSYSFPCKIVEIRK